METRSPLRPAINARTSLQEDARKRDALAVPMENKAKSMWKAALDHVTHPFVEEDLKCLTNTVKRLGNAGPIEDTYVADLASIVDDDEVSCSCPSSPPSVSLECKRFVCFCSAV